jgi:hypothetical protein
MRLFLACLVLSLPTFALEIKEVATDLVVPEMQNTGARPGLRVRQTVAEFAKTDAYHSLYLPLDWQAKQRYPILVEFAGNGNYRNKLGDVSTGKVEGSKMGYGISAGRGYIWLCLPYLNNAADANVIKWWGNPPEYDPRPTLAYCQAAIRETCTQFGGDPARVILLGFSRGAIAVNYLGLYNDEIAPLWQAFIAFSHYDGVRRWSYPHSDRRSAIARLKRLANRPQLICAESAKNLEGTRSFIRDSGVQGPFTFMLTGFVNHNDAWLLRPSPARRKLRKWLADLR